MQDSFLELKSRGMRLFVSANVTKCQQVVFPDFFVIASLEHFVNIGFYNIINILIVSIWLLTVYNQHVKGMLFMV